MLFHCQRETLIFTRVEKMLEFTILVAILIIGVSVIYQSRKKDPKKIFDVYSQPGKWFYLKYIFMLCVLTLRRLKYYLNEEEFIEKTKQLDKLQTLSEHKLVRFKRYLMLEKNS